MTSLQLDDINQTCIYVPYEDSGNNDNAVASPALDDNRLRLKIYRQAWAKCLTRIQNIIRILHAPIASDIVRQMREAYTDVLPGLPYIELPVISMSSQGGGNLVLHEVAAQFETRDDLADDDDSVHSAMLVHLHPSDCPNIISAMRSLIMGFIDASPEGRVKRKATTSLANYDIELLKSWYSSSKLQNDAPQLVVILHDFEQFEPNVIQDMFYICSLHIPHLPFVFILSLSSPSEPSYLHAVYPRSILALLCVRNVPISAGIQVLEHILFKTFFDLEFDPDIMLGPGVLDFIYEYFTRHNCSLDSVISIIQLTYLKHVDEPLTVFLYDCLLGEDSACSGSQKLQQPSFFQLLEYSFTRILTMQSSSSTQWPSDNISALLATFDNCREEFRIKYRKFKVGFCLFIQVRKFMLESGFKSVEGGSTVEIMSKGLRGRLSKEWKYFGIMIKKLSMEHVVGLTEQLSWYFEDMPEGVFEQEAEARRVIGLFHEEACNNSGDGDDAGTNKLAARIGEWFIEYYTSRLNSRLDECSLWDIWYTGSTPFPSELIDPAPRAHITAALLHPESYTSCNLSTSRTPPDDREAEPQKQPELWELPDTSILFRRYLEAGRMINVYDWFESFAVVLENQRRELVSGEEESAPPTKKGKERTKQDKSAKEETVEDHGMWDMEVHARFIRAVHELDLIGLIKHTSRKADHVIKTVFDVLD